MPFIFINGNFYSEEDAKISVKDRGFRFGDGIFETLKFHKNKLYRWDLHLKRLEEGLAAIKIAFNTDNLFNNIKNTIAKNQLESGSVRLAITRGEGSRGYLPTNAKPSNLVIEAMPAIHMERTSGDICISSYRKIPASCLPVNCKLSQGMNSTLAKLEAKEKGYFEALQLTVDNHLAEGASSNIFWVKDDIIHTPSLDCGILAGITREVILELSPYKIMQGKYNPDELKTADEIFITNTTIGIFPISQVENIYQSDVTGNVVTQLQHLLLKDISG